MCLLAYKSHLFSASDKIATDRALKCFVRPKAELDLSDYRAADYHEQRVYVFD